jgi:hypothetical protein
MEEKLHWISMGCTGELVLTGRSLALTVAENREGWEALGALASSRTLGRPLGVELGCTGQWLALGGSLGTYWASTGPDTGGASLGTN